MKEALWLAIAQWGCALGCLLLTYAVFGGLSLLPVPIGFAFAAFLFFMAFSAKPLTRAHIRHLSKGVGLYAIAVATLLYWTSAAVYSDTIDLTPMEVLWLGPVLGCGVGLLTLVCTLIAGDTAAAIRSDEL